jgi:hypothetical protein
VVPSTGTSVRLLGVSLSGFALDGARAFRSTDSNRKVRPRTFGAFHDHQHSAVRRRRDE